MPARLLCLAAFFGMALVACSSADSADVVAITATDKECRVGQTDLKAGESSFKVTNEGDSVTEVYVYANDDRVVAERENIGPATSATFSADLAAGSYEIACKPGQTGDGIRQPITVTGSGGAAVKPADRTVQLEGGEYEFIGMENFSAKAGETVGFELKNIGTIDHEFEVLLPSGEALGEIGPTKAGAVGKVSLTFSEPGTYRFVCGIDDHEERGMAGTFTVT